MKSEPAQRIGLTAEFLTRVRIEKVIDLLTLDHSTPLGEISETLNYHPSATVRLLQKLQDSGLVEKPRRGQYLINRRLTQGESMKIYLPFLDTAPNHVIVEKVPGGVAFFWGHTERGILNVQEWGQFSKRMGALSRLPSAERKKSWLRKSLSWMQKSMGF